LALAAVFFVVGPRLFMRRRRRGFGRCRDAQGCCAVVLVSQSQDRQTIVTDELGTSCSVRTQRIAKSWQASDVRETGVLVNITANGRQLHAALGQLSERVHQVSSTSS
jgi:hypothetical protein